MQFPASRRIRAIQRYEGFLNGERIKLFCLSHFDEDHLNGARRILQSHRIDILVLPYVPLVERMLLATQNPNISSAFLSFLADPVAYLFSVQEGNLGQIIFITGGPAPEEQQSREPEYNPEGEWTFKIPPPDSSNESPGDEANPTVSGHSKPATSGRN
jgi:hypothetical protein